MNVMYAADENFVEILGVSMMSLMECNKRMEQIHFFIVPDGISIENISKLRSIVEKYHREITFLEKPDVGKKTGVTKNSGRWSDSAYSRLFMEELFIPYPEIKKILYLDCDILVVSSLQELWETDIDDFPGAACMECMGNLHKKALGLEKTDPYFNSGVLLLNMERWRMEKAGDAFDAFIREYGGKTEYADQGIINGAVGKQLKVLEPRYNLTTLAYDFSWEEMQIFRKPEFGYSREEWRKAVENPALIHFTTSFLSLRPWQEGSMHPYAGKWKEYHDRSPWKDVPLRNYSGRKRKEFVSRIYHSIPGKLPIRIAGFLHSYVKPLRFLIEQNNRRRIENEII